MVKETGQKIRMAVNVSARQFRSEQWLNEVLDCLNTSGIAPGDLELEITESLMLEDVMGTVNQLHRLRERNVQVAIDDFGTG